MLRWWLVRQRPIRTDSPPQSVLIINEWSVAFLGCLLWNCFRFLLIFPPHSLIVQQEYHGLHLPKGRGGNPKPEVSFFLSVCSQLVWVWYQHLRRLARKRSICCVHACKIFTVSVRSHDPEEWQQKTQAQLETYTYSTYIYTHRAQG